jgi:hypothetical protein
MPANQQTTNETEHSVDRDGEETPTGGSNVDVAATTSHRRQDQDQARDAKLILFFPFFINYYYLWTVCATTVTTTSAPRNGRKGPDNRLFVVWALDVCISFFLFFSHRTNHFL